jgi:hypothetical protein
MPTPKVRALIAVNEKRGREKRKRRRMMMLLNFFDRTKGRPRKENKGGGKKKKTRGGGDAFFSFFKTLSLPCLLHIHALIRQSELRRRSQCLQAGAGG